MVSIVYPHFECFFSLLCGVVGNDRICPRYKGPGCGNVEGISDNFAVVSSVDINPSQRPTLDQASQPQAQPIGIPEASILVL